MTYFFRTTTTCFAFLAAEGPFLFDWRIYSDIYGASSVITIGGSQSGPAVITGGYLYFLDESAAVLGRDLGVGTPLTDLDPPLGGPGSRDLC